MDKFLPFLQVTLPLMVTFVASVCAAQWSQNKRFDDLNRRLDDIVARLTRIESLLTDHDKRIAALETRKWR